MNPRVTALAAVAALALDARAAVAQDHSHQPEQPTPAVVAPGPADQANDHDVSGAAKDDATMNHSTMDHATMDHEGMHHEPTEHASMDHSAMHHTMPATQEAPDMPREPIPLLTDADRVAAFPDVSSHLAHETRNFGLVHLNRFETWDASDGGGLLWEGQGWFGGDLNKLWVRSEGEHVDGTTEAADVELLYGRAVARWWDVVAGVRQDFDPGSSQAWAAVGVVGLAPQKFEIAATAYVGDSGRTAARFEVEYELLLTNRLIAQPLLELNLLGKDDPERGLGSGVTTAEIGVRLRYEVTRQFAPYLGVVYERAYGNTADFRREDGEDVDDTRVVAGLRVWF